ncbi:MAG: hypothetical protein QM817_10365 [Archangium sp.]
MSESKPFQSSPSPAPQKKPDTFEEHAKGLWGTIFRSTAGRYVAALVVGGVGTVSAYALAQSRIDAGIEPLRAELAEVRKDAAEAKRQSANAERIALETNLNVRLIAEALKLQPITIEPKDGGQ